jgi:hypothetical protein
VYYVPPGGNVVADVITYTMSDVRTNPPVLYRPGDSVRTAVGTIFISARPYIQSLALSGGNLRISGTNGAPGAVYYVLTSTNVLAPLNQWQRLATNSFDGNGSFIFTKPLDNAAQSFYRLQLE